MRMGRTERLACRRALRRSEEGSLEACIVSTRAGARLVGLDNSPGRVVSLRDCGHDESKSRVADSTRGPPAPEDLPDPRVKLISFYFGSSSEMRPPTVELSEFQWRPEIVGRKVPPDGELSAQHLSPHHRIEIDAVSSFVLEQRNSP